MKNIKEFIYEAHNNADGFVLIAGSDGELLSQYSVNDLNEAIADARKEHDKNSYSSFYVLKTINGEYGDVEDYEYCVFETDVLDDDSKIYKVIDKFGNPLVFGSKNACSDFYEGYVNERSNYNYFLLPITKYEAEYLKNNKIKFIK